MYLFNYFYHYEFMNIYFILGETGVFLKDEKNLRQDVILFFDDV